MFQVLHKSKQEFEAGLAKAKNFYDGARYYGETREPSLAMFMLQQAAELTFRTIAISLYGIEKRRIRPVRLKGSTAGLRHS